MFNTEYGGIERRTHLRMRYPAAARPVFRFRGQRLEIKDVSRGGLRFSCREKIKIRGWVNGRLELIDGTSIKVEGVVVRVDNEDMGLSFIGELKDDVYRLLTTASRISST